MVGIVKNVAQWKGRENKFKLLDWVQLVWRTFGKLQNAVLQIIYFIMVVSVNVRYFIYLRDDELETEL